MTAELWDRIYETATVRELPWSRSSLAPEIESWFERGWLSVGARVLEIGCGEGIDAVELAQRGLDVVGIDLSAVAVGRARRHAAAASAPAVFVQADVTTFVHGGRFDFVFDYCAFHHVQEPCWPAYKAAVLRHLESDGCYGLVCFADADPSAGNRRVRVGDFGNALTHARCEDLTRLFAPELAPVHYSVTRLGADEKHVGHHFVFTVRG